MIINDFMKKRVLLRGPMLTQSGYGVHARQVARWLLSRTDLDVEFQALPWGDTPWLIDPDLGDGLIGKIMQKTVDPGGKLYDATIQLQLPNEWDPRLGKINVGITAGVETDRCNPEWIKACNSMTSVIVPSKHARDCIKSSGNVTVPMHVIPEAYSDDIGKDVKTSIDDLDLSTPFNFLIFGQLTGNNPENDRKNIFYTIKWLCEAFKDDKDVGIVVKTNLGRNTNIDRKIVTQTMAGLLREVRSNRLFPRVHLLHGDMSDAEVASLYRHPKIKALLTATRGEGYGLPILEAAASGLPVIATRWSGHVDFLSHGKYIELDYRLDAIHPSRVDNKIFMPGFKWAHPLEEDFKKKVVTFRHNSEIPKLWARDMRTIILEKYSISTVIGMYNEALREVI